MLLDTSIEREFLMSLKKLEQGIIENLPQIPYIVDQVGEAMKWLKEEVSEEKYEEYLIKTSKVAEYTKNISEANFYKFHLVIASLLMGLGINPLSEKRFEIFDSPSKSVETALKNLMEDPEVVKTRGCYQALTMHLSNLARTDQDCFIVILMFILCDLEELKAGMTGDVKSPVTKDDYINVLGYAFVIVNIEVSNLPLRNEARDILNKIRILLNSLSY